MIEIWSNFIFSILNYDKYIYCDLFRIANMILAYIPIKTLHFFWWLFLLPVDRTKYLCILSATLQLCFKYHIFYLYRPGIIFFYRSNFRRNSFFGFTFFPLIYPYVCLIWVGWLSFHLFSNQLFSNVSLFKMK